LNNFCADVLGLRIFNQGDKMDAFMGTVLPVAFNYAPRGWLFCNGQTIPIAQNSAMFALLGTMYGGDGQTTFGIPDLRGRTIVGSQAQGPGLNNVSQGEKAGTNSVTVIATGNVVLNLTAANLPAHTHPATMTPAGLTANTIVTVGTSMVGTNAAGPNNGGLTNTPTGAAGANLFLPAGTGPTTPNNLGGVSTQLGGTANVNVAANTGGGAPLTGPVTTTSNVSIMQPYLGLNYIIAMEGIFPSRN
jgi:microcystin-dependent protein